MKQLHITFLLTVLMSMVGAKAFAHDIEVKNADGVTIYYNYTNNDTELAVSYRGSSSSNYSNDYLGNVVIPETVTYYGTTYSVTSIGGEAFRSCSGLTSVTIPNSVTSIGYSAFRGCTGLTSVTIPNSVTSIGNGAFYGCSGLTCLTIPNSVTSIGENAFGDCSMLSSLDIEDGEESLNFETHGYSAFYDCPLNTLFLGRNINTGSFPFEGKKTIKKLTLGSFVTNLVPRQFMNCSGLTSVTIPNSVTSIGGSAFSGCTGLTSITIPNSVTTIGSYAFSGCTGLTSITIPNSVTSIGDYAFSGCLGLQSVVVGNGITRLPERVLGTGNSLKTLTIGSGVLSIHSDAFYNGSSRYRPIKTIWLTNTPPTNYSYAEGTVNYVANDLYTSLSNKTVYPFLSSLFEVDGVKYVPVSPSERTCDAIDCLYDDGAENIHIGKTVTNQGITLTVKQVHPYAFYKNTYIKDVDLSFSGNVGNNVFYQCTALSNVKLSNAGNINQQAFYGCTVLKTATINNKGSLGNDVFRNCSGLETATLGEEIPSIGTYAFSGCSSLKEITIPNAVKTLGQYAFQDCSKMTTVKMGTGIKSIETYTFSGCSSLTDMQIGSNVATINTDAFSGCTKLPVINIPRAVTDIKNYVFYKCTSLKTVIMEDRETVLNLGSNGSSPIFSSCPLDSVYIGGNINYSTSSSYGYSPFYRNTSLRAVMITDKETEISENEFYGCTNLKNVYIGDGVESIGNWAFSGCSNLDYFAFGTALKAIGKEAFSDCTAITHIISHAATPPACGTEALDDINKWTCMLQVPTGFVDVYKAADQWKEFFYVNGGSEVVVDETPKDGDVIESAGSDGQTIYYKVINNGTELEVIYRGEKPDSYNEYSGKVVIPETVEYKGKSYSVTSIGKYAFYGCNGITSVSIPVSIKQIDISSFNKGMDSFKEFHVASIESWCNIEFTRIGFSGNHPLELARHLFVNDEEVTNLVIPNTVTAINYAAFWGCYGITSVTIPNSVKTIDDYSFANCKNITSLNIGNSVDSIGRYAFLDCSGLKTVHCFAETVPSTNSEAFEGTPISNVYLYVPASPVSLLDSYKATSPWKDFGHILAEGTTAPQNGDKIAVPNADGVTIYYEVTSDGWVNVTYRGSSWSEYTNEYTGTITIPATVTYNNVTYEVNGIGVSAFRGCTGLVSLTFEGHVAFFNKYAFVGATGLKELVLSESQRTAFTSSNNRMFDECYKTNTILYVPEAKVAAFSTNEIGTCFKAVMSLESREIISVDDNNVLVVDHLTGKNNNQVVLPVGLKNDKQITGLQFDLYLPEGMTVATNARGKMLIEATDRMDGNFSISSNTIGNFVRVTGYSPDGDAFTGNEGDILNITLNIGEDVADGDYTVRIKDIVLSDVTNTEYHPADIGATVTVKSYVIGDVDNSGAININDVVCIINYILNKSNGTFIAEAADVDGSGTININDVVTLINRYILMKTSAPAMFAENASHRAASVDENYLHLDDINIDPGETKEVKMLMTNTGTVAAIQGKLTLPAGLSIVKKSNGRVDAQNINARSEDFTLSTNVLEDGSLTFAQYSADGFTYEGSEGGIFTFKIKADETATAGTYSLTLSNVVLSIDGVGYDIPDRMSSLTVTGTSGIGLTPDSSPECEDSYYTLDGQKLNGKPTQKGVYIQNGKKIIVK